MALMNNPATTGINNKTNQNENIYTANANAKAPQKVGSRQVELVPNAMATAGAVDSAKAYATTGAVDNNSTVQGQLKNILASGSPLLTRAQTDAAQASAERGLNNTSMGVQAGEEALIRTATPIAQQDAQTYANQNIENQRSVNQFGEAGLNQSYTAFNQNNQNQFTAGESALDRDFKTAERLGSQDYNTSERTASQDYSSSENVLDRDYKSAERIAGQDYATAENIAQSDRALQSNKELSTQSYEQNKALQEIDAQQKLAMNDIQNQFNREINASQTGVQLFQNHQNTVAQIMSDPNITPSQAQASIAVLNQSLKDGLELAGALNGVDMSQYANPLGVGGEVTTGKNPVTTFNNVAPVTKAPEAVVADQKKQAWYDEQILIPRRVGGSMKMSRTDAIAKGYIKDSYKA